jgi:hypothetical protein
VLHGRDRFERTEVEMQLLADLATQRLLRQFAGTVN